MPVVHEGHLSYYILLMQIFILMIKYYIRNLKKNIDELLFYFGFSNRCKVRIYKNSIENFVYA